MNATVATGRRPGIRRLGLAAIAGLSALAALQAPVLVCLPLLAVSRLFGLRLPATLAWTARLQLATLVAGMLLETGAWAHNLMRDAAEPALFHPQLLADLLMAAGFYAGWGPAWAWLARRFAFTTRQVFVATALYGVFIEQQGRIFLLGLSTLPTGALLWLFVAMAYGSTMALAWTWAGDPATTPARDGLRKYPLAMLALFVCSVGLMLLWNLPLEALHLLPPKQLPMRAHPFW